jgi:periplasmic protein TonB
MSYVRANLFDEREKWGESLLLSVVFHCALVVGVFGLGFVLNWHSSTNDWGSNKGDAVDAVLVSGAAIPIPHPQQQTQNIVANESKGVTQTQPQPKVEEPQDALPIQGKVTPKKIDRPTPPTHVQPRAVPTPVETAVPYGEGGPVSGPYGSFSAPNTKGGFSVQNSGFADKYGWYVDVIRHKVQQNWLTYEIDPRITAPHRAYIEFDITRDGSPANVRVEQPSGVPSLDTSAVRAVQRIDGFGAVPDGETLHVEFWFDHPPK